MRRCGDRVIALFIAEQSDANDVVKAPVLCRLAWRARSRVFDISSVCYAFDCCPRRQVIEPTKGANYGSPTCPRFTRILYLRGEEA
jgi:hypothetical protein